MDFKHENIEGIAISVRELHKQLGIKKDFTSWFKYQCKKLKLVEEKDFTPLRGKSAGGRPSIDYITSLDMGKHLCMVSNSERAHEIREYFIEVEKKYNSPDAVIAWHYILLNTIIQNLMGSLAGLRVQMTF